MKRRFTILTAALALLTFLAVPMGMRGQATTYEQLTSIANIDEDAQYVLGIDGTGFHYSNTSGWGLTGLPVDHTPYYYRLVVAEDGQSFKAYIDTPIYGNTYYMTIPTSNAFSMSTSSTADNTDLVIGTDCAGVQTPNYAVANKTTTARHLRRNGSSGLRSYAGTTGSVAYFYKVVSGPIQLDAPTITATSSNGKVTLTWDNVDGASSYTVQYADNSSFTSATTITNATSPNEISGLTNGTTYYFKAMSVGDGTNYLSSDYCTAISSTPSNYVTITITQDDIEDFTNTYDWYDWSDGEVSGKLYSYKNAGMQFNSTKTAYWIYNSTAVPGKITSVKMTKASGTDRSWTLKVGNTALTTTTDGTQIGNAQTVGTNGATWNVSGSYNYFLLYVSGGSTVISSIEITYTPTSASDPSISANNVEIAYDAISGSIMGEIVNYVEGTVSAATDADWISNFTYDQADEIFEVDFTAVANPTSVARTANVTLTFTYGNNETVSRDVTVSQIGDPNAPGTQNNPFTVSQAKTFIDGLNGAISGEVYVTGIISQIDDYNSNFNSITYWISDDGTTTNQLEVYSGKGLNGADFNSINDLVVGSIVTVKGNLQKYGEVYEFNYNSEIVSLTPPAQYTLTAAMTNVAEYFVFVGDDEIEFDENNQAQVRAGATVGVSIAAMEDCFIFGSLTVNGSSEGVTQEDPNDPYFTFEMPEGNATIDVTSSAATQYTLTVAGLNNVTYTDMLAGVGSEEVTLTNNQATLCEGINVDIVGLSANAGLLLESVTLNDGTTTTTLELEYGVYHFTMPSSNATLTFTTTTAQTYTLATTIESGKTYIIVGFDDDDAYAMAEQKSSNRAGVAITVDGTTATGNADVHEVVITALDGNDAGKYTIEVVDGYLYASSSTANQLKTETTLDANGNGKWTIVIVDGEATITAQGTNSRKLMRFNPNNGSPLFACYATNNTTGSLPKLYVKDEPASETYNLTVTGYADYSAKDGYCLIASPVTVDPATVEGMVVADTDPNYEYFDLYSFANDQDDEWQNYKYNQFNLVPGTGYLYAKKATTEGETFSFQLTGIPYSGNGLFELTNAGWNLVGNPFYANVTVDAQEFLVMNGDGSQIIPAESSTIAPMQGIFVYANEEGESVTFIQADGNANPNSNPSVVMNLIQNRGSVIDRAIVRFGEGNQLPKFQLFENSTELYIPQDNEDYAIVRSEAQGELPVSFRASENGTYTLSMNVENVDMNYLHLIDNMTGMDVDLLQTPSYTFEANTNDYANRFKLVFAANGTDEADESSFAFFSNGNLIVNNEGNATLQVIDINGRILSSETISGSCSKAINATTGVYMLRLINGDNVKVQKVVVR